MRRLLSLPVLLPFAIACTDTPLSPPSEERGGGGLATAAVTTAADFEQVDLGTLGGTSSIAIDLNKHDVVAGNYQTSTGATHAFRWTRQGGMIDLPPLPGQDWSTALRVLEDGRVLGLSRLIDPRTYFPTTVIWSSDGVVDRVPIPFPEGTFYGSVTDGNEAQQFIGYYATDEFPQRGWFWSEPTGWVIIRMPPPSTLGNGTPKRINAHGVVTGELLAFNCPIFVRCYRAYRWDLVNGSESVGRIAGDDSSGTSVGAGINDDGVVVGWTHGPFSTGPFTYVHAFRWPVGAPAELLPSAGAAAAYAIDREGNIFGTAQWSDDDSEPVIWPAVGGVIGLNPTGGPGAVMAVNDRKNAVGWESGECCGGAQHAIIWRYRWNLPTPDSSATPVAQAR